MTEQPSPLLLAWLSTSVRSTTPASADERPDGFSNGSIGPCPACAREVLCVSPLGGAEPLELCCCGGSDGGCGLHSRSTQISSLVSVAGLPGMAAVISSSCGPSLAPSWLAA